MSLPTPAPAAPATGRSAPSSAASHQRRPTGTASLTWRLIRDEPCSGARNMARDHALAACLAPGEGVLRLYGWERPTVSFGRNEPAAGLYSIEAARAHGIDFVRRPTGGRAVLHDRELTYAVVAPLGAWGGVRDAYVRINDSLAEALRFLGAAVDVTRGGHSLAPDAGPCFQLPAAGEIVAGGRKVVGSAQARVEGALLQHGSILMDGSQSALEELSGRAPGREHSVTLRELVGRVSMEEVAGAVVESMGRGWGGTWTKGAYGSCELDAADRLEAEKYSRDSWTWRR